MLEPAAAMTDQPDLLVLESQSTESTERLGGWLGERLPAGSVLSLVGDLGAGKTALVRGLAGGLGIDPEEVSSPTYALQNELPGRLMLHHFDAWIENRESLFTESGGTEALLGNGVCAIEWAGGLAAHLPVPRLELSFCHHGEHLRRIALRVVVEAARAPRAQAAPAELKAALQAVTELVRGFPEEFRILDEPFEEAPVPPPR